jgi:hypothetical protein
MAAGDTTVGSRPSARWFFEPSRKWTGLCLWPLVVRMLGLGHGSDLGRGAQYAGLSNDFVERHVIATTRAAWCALTHAWP